VSFLDDVSGIFSRAGDVLSNTGTVIANSWQGAVEQLKLKAREFMDLFTWLESKRHVAATDPQVKAEYDAVMNKGRTVKATVEKTTGGIDWITGQLRARFGLAAPVTMGALPLVPIAVIAAAVAMITAWLADAYKLKSKITYIESHGITGSAAVDILGGNSYKELVGLAVIAAAVYFFSKRG